jgi:myosin heavy subunit
MAARGKTGAPHDLILLDDVSNQAIVDALQKHLAASEIYTWIGPVLISVNPYSQSQCAPRPAVEGRQLAQRPRRVD